MHHDEHIGQVVSRRDALRLLGVGGLSALLVACGADPTPQAAEMPNGTCVVKPQYAEGPYFVETGLNRSDIRSDPTTDEISAGVPLTLDVSVMRLEQGACAAFPGVTVDVWHCNADGAYSGVRDGQGDNVGKQFLRGYQVTDDQGRVTFTTVYPGWYPGRAVHIHFKLRTDPDSPSGTEFVSQWFFPETINDTVHQQPPYAERGPRNVRNTDERVSDQLVLDVNPQGEGYRAAFTLALDV